MPDQLVLDERIRRLAKVAAGVVAAIGLVVLVGWLLGVQALVSVLPGLVAMNPLTAVLFILSSAALWILADDGAPPSRGAAAKALATAVALGGAAVLVVYFGGWNWGPDRLLFAAQLGGNRMAPNTAVLFVLTGLALLLLAARPAAYWISQSLTVVVAAGAMISLVGYGFGTLALYGVASFIPMALNTAILFAVTAVGILCTRPEHGLIAILAAPHLGGVMARRLLPAAILIPFVIGLLRLLGQQAGWYDREYGLAVMVVMNIVMLVGAVVLTATALNNADAQRRQATADLHRSLAEVRDLYNNAPCGYHSLDANGLIVAVNDTELKWLGYARHEIEGIKQLADLLAAGSQQAFLSSFARFQHEGGTSDWDFVLVRKDGTTLPVTVSATAIRDAGGRFVASRCSVFDATERKRAEQEIRLLNAELEQRVAERTSELASANRDLVQKNQENEMFVYSVSHDLRSPLVSLQGFSKELGLTCSELESLVAQDSVPAKVRDQSQALIDGGMRQSIRFIQSGVLRLSNIIDALLRLSRAGRVEYQNQTIDVQSLVLRVVESTRLAQFDGAVEIRVGDLPPCSGDATAVEQVFANLIGNAIKYRDPSRPCEIEVGTVPASEADGEASAGEVTYCVKDTGLGVPDNSRDKIFLAFKRAHPGVAEGDGMGLAIVKRIVDRHGGRVWVESEVGKGSVFYVALPAARGMASPPKPVFKTGGSTHVSRTDGHPVGRR